jgi:putative CRISPR-associated protein (TIGR02619 family)
LVTQRFILSTVGISTLLRAAEDQALRRRLIGAANDEELGPELAQEVAALEDRLTGELRADNVARNRALSAELNGLYGLYDDQLARGRGDMHYLIATDTALGQMTADLIKDYLGDQGLIVDVYTPAHLSAADPTSFSRGIKELIEWCEKTIPGYRESGYRVIFNLTGGFKSLQGYLNIVGMFYADKMVYIFEGSDDLLTIPRLPIEVAYDVLCDYRVPLAMMSQGHLMAHRKVEEIPGGLLDVDGQLATLSDWGFLVWSRARHDLLEEELMNFPRLRYTDRFRKVFEQALPHQRVALQETLARVSGLLESTGGDPMPLRQDGGLQYDNYTNVRTRDGCPIGHFRLTRGRRVSCTLEEGGVLLLRTFGEHDYVNNKP